MKPTKMNTANESIKCSVDTCHYYGNSYCTANNIQVNAMGDGVANTSDGTCCKTFTPKQS